MAASPAHQPNSRESPPHFPASHQHDETTDLRRRLQETDVFSEQYIDILRRIHIPPEVVEAQRREEEAEERRIAEEEKKAELQRAKCSLCNKSVPTHLAKECLEVLKKPFRQQAAFCDRHNEFEAQQKWDSRGYPWIKWESLPERIVRLYPDIQATITGERWSAFEDPMNETCCTRGDGGSIHKRMRLTALNDERLRRVSVGYYGPRGAAIL